MALEVSLLEKEAVISKKDSLLSKKEADILEKEALLSEKCAVIQKLTKDLECLAFQNDQMRRLIFGSKRERFIPQEHPDQLTLSFEEEIETVSKAVKEEQEKIRVEYERRKVSKKTSGSHETTQSFAC